MASVASLGTRIPAAADMAVSIWSQRNSAWGGKILGDNPKLEDCGCNHCRCNIYWNGCFITSLANLFNYYQPNYTDPGKLNDLLLAKQGFQAGTGFINWAKTTAVVPPGSNLQYDTSDLDWTHVDRELAAGHPVLADVFSKNSKGQDVTNQHMVVLSGKNDQGYTFVDPWSLGPDVPHRFTCKRSGNTLPCGAPELKGTGYQIRTFRYFSKKAQPCKTLRTACTGATCCNSLATCADNGCAGDGTAPVCCLRLGAPCSGHCDCCGTARCKNGKCMARSKAAAPSAKQESHVHRASEHKHKHKRSRR